MSQDVFSRKEQEAPWVDNMSGLTEPELHLMSHLTDTWNCWLKLESTSDDDTRTVRDCIHRVQAILATRVVGRDYHGYWMGC